MNTYFACPYNRDAAGFYFHTLDEYSTRSTSCIDAFGSAVEEFEIQFIDGGSGDAELFAALGIDQATLALWFDVAEDLCDDAKAAAFYLASQCGHDAEDALNNTDDAILRSGDLSDIAADVFDELYPNLPSGLRAYVDIDAFARDQQLNGDMDEFSFSGSTYTVLNANDL